MARVVKVFTVEQCVTNGGHCWERSPFSTATYPPIYTETCRHCPAYREGSPHPSPIDWGPVKVGSAEVIGRGGRG